LSTDHLITLLAFNVLRGCITNRQILSNTPAPLGTCSSAPSFLPLPPTHLLPPSLYPTSLQLSTPHATWIDIIPDPTWRDNLILAAGTFDEDSLWSDCVGGLFEGFPDEEVGERGVVAWSPVWDVSGWEVSEGFWNRWGWSFAGCGEILKATNRWRMGRGEKALVFEI
jgi:hypothetical protein